MLENASGCALGCVGVVQCVASRRWSWTPEPETTELVASSGIFERLAARFSAGPKGEGRIPSRLGSRAQHTWPAQEFMENFQDICPMARSLDN